MAETQRFNLAEPSDRFTADKRGPRIALLIAVLVLTACVLGVSVKVAVQLESGYRLSSGQVFLFASFVALFGPLAFFAIWLRTDIAPGAIRIVLSEEGIELYGPGARLDRRPWTDSRTAFELQNFASERSEAATKQLCFLVMKRGRTSALTKKAYDVILAECEVRGLILPNLPNRVRSLFTSGAPPIVYRVRGRPPQKAG